MKEIHDKQPEKTQQKSDTAFQSKGQSKVNQAKQEHEAEKAKGKKARKEKKIRGYSGQ